MHSELPAETLHPRSELKELGQYFTPAPVAAFMARLFDASRHRDWRIVDAGAGSGRLTESLIMHLLSAPRRPASIHVTAWEIDPQVRPLLDATLAHCAALCRAQQVAFTARVEGGNFVVETARSLAGDLFATGGLPRFNAAIVNPPYRKLASGSLERRALSDAGIETSNLYTAFLSLLFRVVEPGAELVSINPRSFCSGSYFRSFRRELLHAMALQSIHLIDSRRATFSADHVLQETVILHCRRKVEPGPAQPPTVLVSHSAGAPAADAPGRPVATSELVSSTDPEAYVHLPESDGESSSAGRALEALPCTLAQLGLSVSTGRVVAFRAAPFLREAPAVDAVPLVWPGDLDGEGGVRWPRDATRKPVALASAPETRSLLVPNGCYVLVKRLTAKEERRRVVASLFDPQRIAGRYDNVAFENHLNYVHADGKPLERGLALGLVGYLNSTRVDQYLRRFNGHTQVNATDLRSLRYPDRASLGALASRLAGKSRGALASQAALDALVGGVLDGDR